MSKKNGESSKRANIYHEKQVKALCALHAINNVLQEHRFTKDELDSICSNLDPGAWIWNTHRSVLGIGNYDVNVIMSALEKCGKELVWFDKRKDPEDVVNPLNVFGFILNIKTEHRYKSWWPNFMKKHWIVVKGFDGDYYEIDSKRFEGPELLGKEPELYVHLRQQLDLPETELFLVLEKAVAETKSWKRKDSEEGGRHVRDSVQGIDQTLNVIDLNKLETKN